MLENAVPYILHSRCLLRVRWRVATPTESRPLEAPFSRSLQLLRHLAMWATGLPLLSLPSFRLSVDYVVEVDERVQLTSLVGRFPEAIPFRFRVERVEVLDSWQGFSINRPRGGFGRLTIGFHG
jgi:hypothetical protein